MRKPVRKVRTRSRTAPAAKKATTRKATTSPSRSKKAAAGFDRGESGFKKAAAKKQRQDEEYEKRRNTPFDFRLKPGDEADVVVLDDKPPFFISMHKIQQGKRWVDEVCIADTGQPCPLCSHLNKEGSYTMYLTVLDRRPYKIKSGPNAGTTVKSSRKLLPVKGRNLPKFERAYKKAESRPGLWRGLKITTRRDGDKEAAIGEDLTFEGFLKEAVLKKYGENSVAAPYEEIFTVPTAAELIKRYNLDGSGVAGSEEFENGDGGDYDEEEVGWNN